MSKTTKPVKKEIKSDEMEKQLQIWAHEGTKESINKIEKFKRETLDDDLEFHAQLAYEEACFFYYNPNDEKEEKEFELARMIAGKGKQTMDMMCKLGSIEARLENLKLDEEVHKRVMKNNKDKKDWQYNFSPDFVLMLKHEKEEIEESLEYDTAWLEEAKKMIAVDKYKDIPSEVFNFIHSDFEDGDFWDDEPDKCSCCEKNDEGEF